MLRKTLLRIFFVVAIFLSVFTSFAQRGPGNAEFQPPRNNLWLGTYTKLRLSDKLFWDAQFHYRTENYQSTPLVGRLAQIYNRHGLSYMPTSNFVFTVGPVLRLNYTPEPGNPEFNKLVLEPRIWHEYLFAMPYSRFIVYHRLRIEHRWSIGNRLNDDWIFRNRWRYKFYMAIPLNNTKLMPGTWFIIPDAEIIMQTGNPVGGSPMEDLRIYTQFGYIKSPRVKYTAGLMWTTGQGLNDPFLYSNRWVVRLNVYLSLDLRKLESKVPEIRIFD